MIVCICKNINTAQIVESLNSGAGSVEQVRADTGATSCCGKCQFKVNSLIQDHLSEADRACSFYDAAVSA